jgi:hypothetical protein
MAIIEKAIRLETTKQNLVQAVIAKQGDSNSRYLKVTFLDEGSVIPLDSSSQVTINAEREDGTSQSFFGVVNGDDTATVPLHSWILELDGVVNCDISIIGADGSKLTTTSFVVKVEKAACSTGGVSSDPQGNVLSTLLYSTANALKGTASGSSVSMKDVSPLEHPIGVKLSSDTITDFSSVNLTKQGKNILDISQMTTENEASSIYGDFRKNEDGSYTYIKDGDGANGWQSKVFSLNIKANTRLYLSAEIIRMDQPFYLMAKYANGGQKGVSFNSSSAFIPTDDVTSCFFYTSQSNTSGTTIMLKNIQLEYGETATEYEPYKEPETVSVKQDGTASIIGKGEGITLMTDTEGVTITAEYNVDTKKYIDKKFAELAALIVNS